MVEDLLRFTVLSLYPALTQDLRIPILELKEVTVWGDQQFARGATVRAHTSPRALIPL